MKTNVRLIKGNRYLFLLVLFFQGIFSSAGFQDSGMENYTEYKGEVINSRNGEPVISAYLTVNGTNISTITNNEGKFSLKLKEGVDLVTITVSSLGFQSKTLPLDYFKGENVKVELVEGVEELSEIAILMAKDPLQLVKSMMQKRGENYINDQASMTAFYRESIKRRNQNVSLSEAVVKLHKQPYSSTSKDEIVLIKARKSADYERLDTLALKLRGGPFNTLYLDVMKYPEFLFNQADLDNFRFSFSEPAIINNRNLYVVDFVQKNQDYLWYHGKLFIDAESTTLVRASYSLNVDNRNEASNMFVKEKPNRAKVYPVYTNYQVDYRESDGKWYYGYGNAELEFVVNWKRKLFNTRYTVNSEMAVTDWEVDPMKNNKVSGFLMSPTVVMADDNSGFYDTDFWGNNNIIEPEKSIQYAIEKIQKQLPKKNN